MNTTDVAEEPLTTAELLRDLVVTGPVLRDRHFPPVQWAVPGILPEGYSLLVGSSKVGKSWLCLSFLHAVAEGGKALGVIETGKPRPVLYFALEDGQARIKRRMSDLDLSFPERFSVITGQDMAKAKVRDIRALELASEWLEDHKHDRPVVCIDTLGRILRAAGPGQGAFERDYQLGARFKELADTAEGSSVLVLHHTRKMPAENDFMDAVSGTTAVNGAADATIVVRRKRGAVNGTLSVTGRDIDRDGTIAVKLDQERHDSQRGMLWQLDGKTIGEAMANAAKAEEAAETNHLSPNSQDVIKHVRENPGQGPRAIAAALGLKENAVQLALGRLVADGNLDKEDRGKYYARPRLAAVRPESVGSVGPVTDMTDQLEGWNE